MIKPVDYFAADSGADTGGGGNVLSFAPGSGGSGLVETPAGAAGGGTIKAELLSGVVVCGIDELLGTLCSMGGGGGGMSVVRIEVALEALGCGLTSGACTESDVAGIVAEVCTMPASVVDLGVPQFELIGVPVLAVGGTVLFELSTPPVGMNDPALPAGPVGIGSAVPLEYDGFAGLMVAGGVFQACGAAVVLVGIAALVAFVAVAALVGDVCAAVACAVGWAPGWAPGCVELLAMLRRFPD